MVAGLTLEDCSSLGCQFRLIRFVSLRMRYSYPDGIYWNNKGLIPVLEPVAHYDLFRQALMLRALSGLI